MTSAIQWRVVGQRIRLGVDLRCADLAVHSNGLLHKACRLQRARGQCSFQQLASAAAAAASRQVSAAVLAEAPEERCHCCVGPVQAA